MDEKSIKETFSDLQSKAQEYFSRFEELRGFL